jgi:hypothetical protein
MILPKNEKCVKFSYMHLKLQAILNKGFYYTKVIGAMLVASRGLLKPGWSPEIIEILQLFYSSSTNSIKTTKSHVVKTYTAKCQKFPENYW